jgi:hypothetical protein
MRKRKEKWRKCTNQFNYFNLEIQFLTTRTKSFRSNTNSRSLLSSYNFWILVCKGCNTICGN